MLETDLLPKSRCEEIFGIAAAEARRQGVYEIEAAIGAHANALTRFANNAIHQNVAERHGYLSLRAVIDGRTGRTSTNRLDEKSIRAAVEEAIAVTRAQQRDPSILPLDVPRPLMPVDRYYDATAQATPTDRADVVAEAIAAAESQGFNSAGIFSTNQAAYALLNTHDLLAYHCETSAQFSITVMDEDSSGWAKASSCDLNDIDHRALASRAAEKARTSASPRELPPGRYTVILEPAAVLDLLSQIFGDFSATALRDGRSFLADRIGKKLFGENISVWDDAYHPMQTGAPFDGEGLPRNKLTLVDKGEVREIAYSRQAAHEAGVEPTGHGFPLPNEIGEAPTNIVVAGGDASIEDMIASTRRGILVTRVWYIREVDPYEKIMTGMTRDGTFLIEDGAVQAGLRNFRFNQSLIEMLSNVEALSPSSRACGEESFDMVVPAMKVRDFNFTEVTRF